MKNHTQPNPPSKGKEALQNGPRISFKEVCLKLGGNRILDKVSFTVNSGSIHCIIGPNGGGKTSLLKSLLGQMPHTGTIQIDWPEKEQIGYVPQILDFDRTLPITVNNFMSLACQKRPSFLGIQKNIRDAIGQTLEKVGLSQKRKRILGQLSGGEMQRLLLAQALLPSPSLLVLDEPTTGLDRKGAETLQEILLDYKANGNTIFWIHHDLNEVKKMADDTTCINRSVIFTGNSVDVLQADNIFKAFSSH